MGCVVIGEWSMDADGKEDTGICYMPDELEYGRNAHLHWPLFYYLEDYMGVRGDRPRTDNEVLAYYPDHTPYEVAEMWGRDGGENRKWKLTPQMWDNKRRSKT